MSEAVPAPLGDKKALLAESLPVTVADDEVG
jgi:hypothetical protein